MKILLTSLAFCAAATVAAACSHRLTDVAPAPDNQRATLSSQVVVTVKPVYPIELRTAGVTGLVRIDVQVDKDGRVVGTKVIESDHNALTREAVRAVEQWLFVPSDLPLPEGHRHVRVPIRFAVAAN